MAVDIFCNGVCTHFISSFLVLSAFYCHYVGNIMVLLYTVYTSRGLYYDVLWFVC